MQCDSVGGEEAMCAAGLDLSLKDSDKDGEVEEKEPTLL